MRLTQDNHLPSPSGHRSKLHLPVSFVFGFGSATVLCAGQEERAPLCPPPHMSWPEMNNPCDRGRATHANCKLPRPEWGAAVPGLSHPVKNGTPNERCPESLVSTEVPQLAEDVTESPMHLTRFLPGSPSGGKGERLRKRRERPPSQSCADFFST